MAEILRATQAFSYTDRDGIPQIVRPGDIVSADDPGVKGREHLYEPVEASVSRTRSARSGHATETATAGPGERRTRTRAKTDDKKGDDDGK